MEHIKDLLAVTARVLTIIPLLLFITLFMGRRSVGELPVFDFLIIIVLGSIVGADIADPNINHLPTALAVVVIGLLQKTVSKWSLKKRAFEKLINFEPVVVIKDGKFIPQNLKKILYSIDNVLELLREYQIFDLKEVDIGIIEANGKLTVYKKRSAGTPGDFTFPVVVEGKIYKNGLRAANLSEEWLAERLTGMGFNGTDDIFFASVNEKKELHISPKDFSGIPLPPVFH